MRAGLSDDDLTDTEISILEGENDFSRMERIMEMYGNEGHAISDPSLMMALPAPDLSNIAVMDDEVDL